MSAEGVIERVRDTNEGLRLELAPVFNPECGYDSGPGQPVVVVVGDRTFEPQVGMVLWGAGYCEIVRRCSLSGVVTDSQWYRRSSSSYLTEVGIDAYRSAIQEA